MTSAFTTGVAPERCVALVSPRARSTGNVYASEPEASAKSGATSMFTVEGRRRAVRVIVQISQMKLATEATKNSGLKM
jgi:hypothetical protein